MQKNQMKIKINFFILLFLSAFVNASIGQNDTLTKLSFTNFLKIVKLNHPLVKQANLLTKSAEANVLSARGSFDPILFYDFNSKFYDSKNYYELGNGGFKIPTWYGIELKGGYEQNNGDYLNPENSTPGQGLIYSQISMPLLQGLIIDERRATLKQAKVFHELSTYDKTNAINEILYSAGKVFWEWQMSYANLQVHKNALSLSQNRFDAVRKTALLGDRPTIDTVEANIQLQDRILNLQQALMEYRTKSLLLSNYLWMENNVPIELTDKTIPETTTNLETENALYENVAKLDSILNIHPILKTYEFKIKQLNIEKRYRQDKLKPNLNVNYNPLFNAENLNMGYQNNYKWGVSVGFPIFLRRERGELALTKIKIENTKLEALNKKNELLNKTKSVINEFNTYQKQIKIYSSNVNNYERLWDSEKRLFDSGESSLFMINSREMSYINAQIKLNELLNKTKKAALEAEYSFGILNTIY